MSIRLQSTVSKSETSAITATRPSVMRRARQMVRRLWRDQRGAGLLEYAALACLIGAVCITAVSQVGTDINQKFKDLKTAVGNIKTK